MPNEEVWRCIVCATGDLRTLTYCDYCHEVVHVVPEHNECLVVQSIPLNRRATLTGHLYLCRLCAEGDD